MRSRLSIDQQAHIIIYGRFSTDEQRRQSIEDQIRFCREFLESEYRHTFSNITTLSDEGISGEMQSRPGIDELRRLIDEGLVEYVVSEDSSRLYRSARHCDELVSAAVDKGIRVICINDRVDTADDDWQQRLAAAQQHHSQDNYYTRFRIKRAHDGLWQIGAAIGPILPGYTRAASEQGGQRPPKFDQIDHTWTPQIVRTFELIAEGTFVESALLAPAVT
jgi:DNA invertase Pin-like site-specific DNA recombinase